MWPLKRMTKGLQVLLGKKGHSVLCGTNNMNKTKWIIFYVRIFKERDIHVLCEHGKLLEEYTKTSYEQGSSTNGGGMGGEELVASHLPLQFAFLPR